MAGTKQSVSERSIFIGKHIIQKRMDGFVRTPNGWVYPPNRVFLPVYSANEFMPYSQYRFPQFRSYNPGPYIPGARQALFSFSGQSCKLT